MSHLAAELNGQIWDDVTIACLFLQSVKYIIPLRKASNTSSSKKSDYSKNEDNDHSSSTNGERKGCNRSSKQP